jgi:hypothetical protein
MKGNKVDRCEHDGRGRGGEKKRMKVEMSLVFIVEKDGQ